MSKPLAHVPDDLRVRVGRPLARRLARGALASAWALRHPREPLSTRPERTASEPRWTLTSDGWDLPIRRIPPRPGASGEPVVLAAEMGQSVHTLDALPERSLARTLHEAGYDVWLFHHRGDPSARPPAVPGVCDVDAVGTLDVPALLDRIEAVTGAPRCLWLGHGLGAHAALVYLATGGDRISGLVSIGAPVHFPRASTRARVVGRVAEWLPAEWRVPLGTVADVLAPGPGERLVRPLAHTSRSIDRRSLLLHGTEAVRCGLIRQAARWFEHGHLTDRTGTVDYSAALASTWVPMLVVTAAGDPLSTPGAVAPLLLGSDRTRLHLDETWSHFDPLLAPEAHQAVYRPVCRWLDDRRDTTWEATPF